jgi:hypothetical protein
MHINFVFVCTFVCVSVSVRCSFPHCIVNRKVPRCVVWYASFLSVISGFNQFCKFTFTKDVNAVS